MDKKEFENSLTSTKKKILPLFSKIKNNIKNNINNEKNYDLNILSEKIDTFFTIEKKLFDIYHHHHHQEEKDQKKHIIDEYVHTYHITYTIINNFCELLFNDNDINDDDNQKVILIRIINEHKIIFQKVIIDDLLKKIVQRNIDNFHKKEKQIPIYPPPSSSLEKKNDMGKLIYVYDVFEIIFGFVSSRDMFKKIIQVCWLFHNMIKNRVKIKLDFDNLMFDDNDNDNDTGNNEGNFMPTSISKKLIRNEFLGYLNDFNIEKIIIKKSKVFFLFDNWRYLMKLIEKQLYNLKGFICHSYFSYLPKHKLDECLMKNLDVFESTVICISDTNNTNLKVFKYVFSEMDGFRSSYFKGLVSVRETIYDEEYLKHQFNLLDMVFKTSINLESVKFDIHYVDTFIGEIQNRICGEFEKTTILESVTKLKFLKKISFLPYFLHNKVFFNYLLNSDKTSLESIKMSYGKYDRNSIRNLIIELFKKLKKNEKIKKIAIHSSIFQINNELFSELMGYKNIKLVIFFRSIQFIEHSKIPKEINVKMVKWKYCYSCLDSCGGFSFYEFSKNISNFHFSNSKLCKVDIIPDIDYVNSSANFLDIHDFLINLMGLLQIIFKGDEKNKNPKMYSVINDPITFNIESKDFYSSKLAFLNLGVIVELSRFREVIIKTKNEFKVAPSVVSYLYFQSQEVENFQFLEKFKGKCKYSLEGFSGKEWQSDIKFDGFGKEENVVYYESNESVVENGEYNDLIDTQKPRFVNMTIEQLPENKDLSLDEIRWKKYYQHAKLVKKEKEKVLDLSDNTTVLEQKSIDEQNKEVALNIHFNHLTKDKKIKKQFGNWFFGDQDEVFDNGFEFNNHDVIQFGNANGFAFPPNTSIIQNNEPEVQKETENNENNQEKDEKDKEEEEKEEENSKDEKDKEEDEMKKKKKIESETEDKS